MRFWECFITLLPYAAALWLIFGVVYPAVMIVKYKLSGSGVSVREILKKI